MLPKLKSTTENTKYPCPYNCGEQFTEREMYLHVPRVHGNENEKKICTICVARGEKPVLVGSRTWGYSEHLLYEHMSKEQKQIEKQKQIGYMQPTYAFSLVVIQNPADKKFVLVKEGCKQGYWLPAGRVDPGETFEQAAIRETEEEAGIKVKLAGVLQVEHSPFPEGGGRMRVVFLAHPADPQNVQLKTIPDFESMCAEWISYEDFIQEVKENKKKLRGTEPLIWFKKVAKGCPVYPLSIIKRENQVEEEDDIWN